MHEVIPFFFVYIISICASHNLYVTDFQINSQKYALMHIMTLHIIENLAKQSCIAPFRQTSHRMKSKNDQVNNIFSCIPFSAH
jgi:membrane protein YdbS with pleckstrin-like domain